MQVHKGMIKALIAGERDPAALVDKALRQTRSKISVLAKALAGRFHAHHGVVARAILDHIDLLDSNITVSIGMLLPNEYEEMYRVSMASLEGEVA